MLRASADLSLASKLSLGYVENPHEWVGKEIEVRVITADPEDQKLVLSAKEILREKEAENRKQRVSNVEVGLVTEGTVESLMPYGAFIDLGNGLSGLVHISQICDKRIKHPGAVLKEGQKVKVKVIAVKDGKISLSMKALEDVAAVEIEEETYEMPGRCGGSYVLLLDRCLRISGCPDAKNISKMI